MKTLWAIILIFVLTDNLTGQNTRKNTIPHPDYSVRFYQS